MGSELNLGSTAMAAIVILMIVAIGFLVISKVEANINLTGTWNTTYTNFKEQVSAVFPLLAVALIAAVAMTIIYYLWRGFAG